MIKSIRLKNFQSHKESTLDVCNGVNVIKGQSHSGKSSIIRALYWVLMNRPSGTSFKSSFADKKDDFFCEIVFDDTTISRYRDSKENCYIVGDTKLLAIGSDVPVREALRMSEVNIQTQFDPYFMLNDTPGEVARKLNDVVGLDIIDKLLSKVNSEAAQASSTRSHIEARIEQQKEEIEQLAFIDEIEPLVVKCGELYSKIQSTEALFTKLQTLCVNARKEELEISETKAWLEIEKECKKLKEKYSETAEKQSKYAKLSLCVNEIKQISENIEQDTEWLKIEPWYKEIKNQFALLKEKCAAVKNLDELTNSISTLNSHIEGRKRLVVELENKRLDILRKEGVCPLCRQKIVL